MPDPINPFGTTTDDFGNATGYTFDAQGNPQSPAGYMGDTSLLPNAQEATGDQQTPWDELPSRRRVKKVTIYGYNPDGTPQFQVWFDEGLPFVVGDMQHLQDWLKDKKSKGELPEEAMQNIVNSTTGNGNFGVDADGNVTWSGTNRVTGQPTSWTGGSGGSYSGAAGPGAAAGGASGGAAGRSGGSSGGGASGVVPGGSSTTTTTTDTPNMPIVPGGGGSSIDPNAPLGIPGITPNRTTGSGYFGGGGADMLPNIGNPYANLNENSSLTDVIAAIAGGQLGAQQSAMDILGGLFNESLNSPESQGFRGRINDLLANPYTYNEQEIQRLIGTQNDAIGQRANRLSTSAAARNASAGVRPDSGVSQRAQDVIASNAAQQATEGERQIRMRAAEQNQQDLRSALGTAGEAIGRDQGARRDIGNIAATGVLGNTQILGDAFLTNALLGAQGAGNNQNPLMTWNFGGSSGSTRLGQ